VVLHFTVNHYTGTDVVTWSLDKRYVMEHMTMTMGDGKVMKGLGVWTWDPRAKRFRTWWFDDWSGYGTSVASYCPECRTLCFKGNTKNMAMGFKTVGEGCFRFIDDDTMEWNWKERIPWTPFTVMEMSGTSHRQ